MASVDRNLTMTEFFAKAPAFNYEGARFITGKVCGVDVQKIKDPIMRKIRKLDKFVDELAVGRPMEEILRSRFKRQTEEKSYEYDATIRELSDCGGAYVEFPWDIRQVLGKGRARVHALFDGIPYKGSLINMGAKNPDWSACHIIGLLKSIRKRLGKKDGEPVHVVITPIE